MSEKQRHAEERAEAQEIRESLKVSNIFAQKVLQNMGEGGSGGDVDDAETKLDGRNNSDLAHMGANEGYSPFHLDLFKTAATAIGADRLASAMASAPSHEPAQATKSTKTSSSEPQYFVSKNQFKAIQKFPSLVEYLGTVEGDKIAKAMLTEVNKRIADKIGENSKTINEHARVCVAERHNLKQYYQGPDWVCVITASGPFKGDEAFFYDQESGSVYIVRKFGEKYDNVTREFNVIHEYAEKSQNQELEEVPEEAQEE